MDLIAVIQFFYQEHSFQRNLEEITDEPENKFTELDIHLDYKNSIIY